VNGGAAATAGETVDGCTVVVVLGAVVVDVVVVVAGADVVVELVVLVVLVVVVAVGHTVAKFGLDATVTLSLSVLAPMVNVTTNAPTASAHVL
jgi:hypothetical protein